MTKFFLMIVIVFATIKVQAQKSLIDSNTYEKWPENNSPVVSNDGKYFIHTVGLNGSGCKTLALMEINGDWKKEISCVGEVTYAISSKWNTVVFLVNRKLGIIKLGSSSVEYINGVSSYTLSKDKDERWLVYKDSTDHLLVRNLESNKEKSFENVSEFSLSENGGVILMTKENGKDSDSTELHWVTFGSFKDQLVWKGKKPLEFHFDNINKQVAFRALTNIGNKWINSIWRYSEGDAKAVQVVDDISLGIGDGFTIDRIIDFTVKRDNLLINVAKSKIKMNFKPGAAQVDIWSYNDGMLQSQQLIENKSTNKYSYKVLVHLQSGHVIQIEQPGDIGNVNRYSEGDYLIVRHAEYQADYNERYWNKNALLTSYIVSFKDGTRTKLPDNYPEQSPNGEYLLYFDKLAKRYYSYRVKDKVITPIKDTEFINWRNPDDDTPSILSTGIGEFVGWGSDGKTAYISDYFDIWMVDLSGVNSSKNITNGYGKRNNIVLKLAFEQKNIPIGPNEKLLLVGFNRNTKDNGYFQKVVNQMGDPRLLNIGPYAYQLPGTGIAPIKARDAELYIVMRQSASQSPNYFCTKDFQKFKQLTFLYPEKKFNWLSSELITWNTLDNVKSQGILYKPENFDPLKKYPVIFYCYEVLSNNLHKFLVPSYNESSINIPYFVSRGYLVFTPDIHYTTGEIGPSAVKYVVSAAEALKKLPYVDNKHMGLQGHSFGGFETNYIITHTKIFAAAMSAAGMSDFVSDFASIAPRSGRTLQAINEVGQNRMGTSLWEAPEIYIKNSPVFQAHKVSTPLLMMNNKGDGIVPFSQGVEFFTALRRLGKQVWMLQYDGGEHIVITKDQKIDLTNRVSQFFDFYLKNALAPKWMVKGIPADRKGIDDGLELEPEGVIPRPNLLTVDAQKKVDSLANRKPITITIN